MKNIITYKRIQSNYENVCYVNSIFALFLYLYINKGGHNTLFVSHIDFQALLANSKLDNVVIVNTKLNKNWDSLLYKMGLLQYDITTLIKKKKFFGHDHLTYAFLFDLSHGSVLEDGAGNYNGPIPFKKRVKRALKGRVVSPLGYGNKITSIYLSKPELVDSQLQSKTKVFDVVDMLDYTRNFSLQMILTHSFESLSGKNILFTQPISDLVTEDGKIELYKEIAEKYNITVIKPHPRECTDYTEHFSCLVLDKFIPAEVLISPDDKNVHLYTLNSTSVLNLKEVNDNIQVDLLALDLHDFLTQWKTDKNLK
ncbi:lipooligosaccharide sialyltransferase [Vibrio parahaemolyticus]|uniref:glycosyltransferase family 52 n=2 Tax=Vibrio parahaemolyticus TaxID=670 RepID=UPI0005F146CF|nr:glycosyltransferase family 52 [Vibrio parahaemolyticus]EGR0290158.1 lipooligosaccharide sialyltransferase [Vibrio parahaemolyticus]EHR1162552.1 lipooligosaccharide sialyltransferase [Vibrio parahaemolyticus]EIU7851311.1 lipooligosaccharide sialyltransferase [Vibrio parahaemolyticus]ELA9433000.1 lipooligosaccharide sialyltransferase [Vibrio parahaemolyticus]HAS6471971.1 lipooligosaccharide sialyltransferase [Vibrio parahaemolyticus]